MPAQLTGSPSSFRLSRPSYPIVGLGLLAIVVATILVADVPFRRDL